MQLTAPIKSPTNKKQSEFLSVRQAASFLGLSPSRLYVILRQGRIAFYKPSGKLFFTKRDLIAYLESGRREAKPE